jgi:hypothetical protein
VAPDLPVPTAGTAASYEASGDAVRFLVAFNRKQVAWRLKVVWRSLVEWR